MISNVAAESVCGRDYRTGQPIRIDIRDGHVAAVTAVSVAADQLAQWPWLGPALFDLQINGHGGVWFNDPALTAEQVLTALAPHFAQGLTRLCPTLVTHASTTFLTALSAIRAACEAEPWADSMVAGIHLEGPYLSPLDGPRGAHPREHIRGCDWAEFEAWQAASGGRVRLMTLAPEAPGAVPFIKQAVASGVTIAIGHTAADANQIAAAVDAGARLSTHLGNGCAVQMHRHHNPLWPQLADPRLRVSIITDGFHLPQALIQTIVRAKTTCGVILTCDAAGWAGCPPGVYYSPLGASELLPSGKLVVAGQQELLAGSASSLDRCVMLMQQLSGVPLSTAIDMASTAPAALLGLPVNDLSINSPADLILFAPESDRTQLNVIATIAGGMLRAGAIPKLLGK